MSIDNCRSAAYVANVNAGRVAGYLDSKPSVAWAWGIYDAGSALPGWIRIEERPGARLVANLPPYREADAQAIVDAHNSI